MANILITGANRGIGLELCRAYKSRGAQVIGICRKSSPEVIQTGIQIIEGVDCTDDAGVATLPHSLKDTKIDLLILNAGILSVESIDDLDFDRMRQQFEVNTLGPLRVVKALLPLLTAHSRIAVMSSRMGSMGDNGSGGYYGYRASKAAVNSITVSLARDLKPRGIAVFAVHPGMVATEMTGGRGIPPVESAAMLVNLLDKLDMSQTGSFHHANGEVLPW